MTLTLNNFTPPSPRSAKSAERLMIAARKLFYAHGVDAVSTDQLAKEASISKATMYKMFSDKDELFRAVIRRDVLVFREYLESVTTGSAPIRETIKQFGIGLLELLHDPDVIRFEQLLIGRSVENPETAQTFFREAHTATTALLSKLIEKAQKDEQVTRELPAEKLATHLVKLWEGRAHSARQLGLPEGQIKDIEAHVEEAMQLILS